jgi:glycosyltransferase involved in cell wall biosynthesis
MMAQFSKNKGFGIFLKSIALLFSESLEYKSRFNITIVGVDRKSPYHAEFMSLLKNYNLIETVRVIEYTSSVDDILNFTHILVRPSLSMDPWGRDIIEAMSFGCSIVAFGGFSKFVRNDYNGVLISSPDAKLLMRALIKIYKDGCIKCYCINSYNLARELFDAHSYSEQLSAIYRELSE